MAKGKEVANTAGTEVIPSYIKQGEARGSEGVGMDDLTIPRLELVQSLSPCRDEDDPAYIDGIKEGNLYNNVSREIYGDAVTVIPVIFKKEYLVWRDRKLGGGFRGAYDSMEEANSAIVALMDDDPDNNSGLEATDTAQHLCLLVRPNGKTEEIALSMSRSKMKISRQWNSLIRMIGGDRFGRTYTIEGVNDTNNKGEKFKNLKVSQEGFPSEDAYIAAEALYEQINTGERELKVNADQDGTEEPETNGANQPNF